MHKAHFVGSEADKKILLGNRISQVLPAPMQSSSKNIKPVSSNPPPGALIYLLGFIGVVLFGITLPVTQIALAGFSPWFLTFGRALIAAGLAIIMLAIFRKPFRHHHSFETFLAGVFLIFGFPGLMALAMQTVPASHGGVVLGFLPLATAILARLIAGEHPSPKFWALSLCGGLLVAMFTYLKADNTGASGISLGDIWLILAGLCASAGYVIFGKLSRDTAGWEVISRALVLNIPLILAGCIWFWEPHFAHPTINSAIALVYLGTGSMYLGFCAWNVALALGGIARIGQMQLLQTFVTLIAAAVLLGESVDAVTIFAAIAITAIVAFTRE